MHPTYRRTSSRLALALVAFSFGVSACGEETPERAIYSLAHDLEHQGYDGACERVYPRSKLGPEARKALGLQAAAGEDWEPGQATCVEAFERGSLANFEFVEPRVRSVDSRSLKQSGDVTAIATARVALDGSRPETVPLVQVDGRWLVVPVGG